MTVATTANRIVYNGNGATTAFSFPYRFFANSDLVVTITTAAGVTSTKVLNTDYTVAGAGLDSGGVVTMAVAPASGEKLTVQRILPITQGVEYVNNDPLPASSLEDPIDRLTMIAQQLSDRLDRAPVLPAQVTGVNPALPVPEANTLLAWNSTGTGFTNASPTGVTPGSIGTTELADGSVTTTKLADLNVTTGKLENASVTNAKLAADAVTNIKVAASAAIAGTKLAFVQNGTGAVTRTVQDKQRERVTLADFGAVGDGTTDDTAAVNAALATGSQVWGDPTKTYAVTGDITLPTTTDLWFARFKQLAPNNASRRTLSHAGGVNSKCHLHFVTVDRNGDGAGGSVANAAAIYIANCPDVLLRHPTVYGNDKGTGIRLDSCTDARIDSPNLRDMRHGNAASVVVTDDQLQGIWLVSCVRTTVTSPKVRNLTGQWTGQAQITRFTRGIAVSGGTDLTIVGADVENVDQGIDITGDLNPERITVLGGSLTNCYSFGLKWANTPRYGVALGVRAHRCGYAGFIASAPSVATTQQTSRIEFIGCIATDAGSNGAWAAFNTAGFLILNSGTYTDYPRSVRIVNCGAYASVAGMKYGFFNQPIIGGNGDQWNETIDCSADGFTVDDYSGFHQGFMYRTRAAAQSIPNATWTDLSFDTVDFDRMLSGSGASITIRRSGIYNISATVGWVANGTGIRGIRIDRNGSAIQGSVRQNAPFAPSSVSSHTSLQIPCNAGDVLKIQVFQESGGALNTNSDTAVSIALAAQGMGR